MQDEAQAAAQDGAQDEAFHDLMGRLDRPMYVLTAAADGTRAGCLVGFATQTCIDPPRFLACVSDKNFTHGVATLAERVAVHVLRRDQHDLAALFGGETGDEVDKSRAARGRRGPAGCRCWTTASARSRRGCWTGSASATTPGSCSRRRRRGSWAAGSR